MSEVNWDKIPEKKRQAMTSKLKSLASKMKAIDYSKPAHTRLAVKLKFLAVRMMQTGLGRDNPEYTDYKYLKENGWLGKVRPWK